MPTATATRLAVMLPALALAQPPSPSSQLFMRSVLSADRLAKCTFQPQPENPWNGEDLWQSGNTIESMSNIMLASKSKRYADTLFEAYLRTPPVVDNCFDDHQWWLLGWVRAAQAVGETSVNGTLYLQRAAQAFDFIAQYGYDTTVCGGGVTWCPAPSSPYKNAITSELFLTAAAELHPYAASLGKPADYYLNWGLKTWNWLQGSGMINNQNLINDGLTDNCQNNGGTTWTYNQGVLLDGLALLGAASGNASLTNAAMAIADAAMTRLSDPRTGVLVEPCGGQCDGDQFIFKGVFVRHLARLAQLVSGQPAFVARVTAYLQTNARSMLANSSVAYPQGSGASSSSSAKSGKSALAGPSAWVSDYGVEWRGPSNPNNTASTSAALDLLTAAAVTGAAADDSAWSDLGLGNCADDAGNGMSNCYSNSVSEADCRGAALNLQDTAAYDYQINCDGTVSCRVRSTSASSANCAALGRVTGVNWVYTAGSATTVTTTTDSFSTICVLKQ